MNPKEEWTDEDFKKLEDWIECMVAFTNQNVPIMKDHAENAINFLDKLAESSNFAQTAHKQLKSLRED